MHLPEVFCTWTPNRSMTGRHSLAHWPPLWRSITANRYLYRHGRLSDHFSHRKQELGSDGVQQFGVQILDQKQMMYSGAP